MLIRSPENMKSLYIIAFLALNSCSYQSDEKSLNGWMRLDNRSDGLGIISVKKQKNLSRKNMTIIYRVSEDNSSEVLTEKSRDLLLDGINPWNQKPFEITGIKSFDIKTKAIFTPILTNNDKNLINDFGRFSYLETETPSSIISNHLYSTLPQVTTKTHNRVGGGF